MRTRTRVRVVAFARIAELAGRENDLELNDEARVRDAWNALVARSPELGALASSTRAAIGGRIVGFDELLRDGDELSFLPPVGGG